MSIVYNELGFFCIREWDMMTKLMDVWFHGKQTALAEAKFGEIKKAGFNTCTGFVWLEDADNNCLRLNNDGVLDLFISTPYDDIKGFLDEIISEHAPSDLNEEDVEYLLDVLKDANLDSVPESWQALLDTSDD